MAVNFSLDLLYKLYRHDSSNGGTLGGLIEAENFNKNAYVVNGNQITVKEADGDVFTYDLSLLSQGESIFTEALSGNDPIGQITKPKDTTTDTTVPLADTTGDDTTTPTTPVTPTDGTTGNDGNKNTTKTKEEIQAELDALRERREKLEAEIQENKGKINDYRDKIDELYKEIEATIGDYIGQAEDISEEIKEQVKKVVEQEIEKYKNGEYDSTKALHNAIAAELQGILASSAMQNLMDELQRVLGDKRAEIEPYIAEVETIEGETEVKEDEVADIAEDEEQLQAELEDAPEKPEAPKEPQGFAIKGADGSVEQFDFFVDRDGNGGLTDATEFLGAQGYEAGGKEGAWAEMTNLDTNGDGTVDVNELEAGNVKVVKTTVDADGNKTQQAMSASEAFGKDSDLKINTTQKATTSESDTPMNFNQFANNELLGNFDVTLNGQTYTGYQTADSVDYLNENYNFTSGSAEGSNTTSSGRTAPNFFREEFKYDTEAVVKNADKSESENELMRYAEGICNRNGIFFTNEDKNNAVSNDMFDEMIKEKEKHIEFAA